MTNFNTKGFMKINLGSPEERAACLRHHEDVRRGIIKAMPHVFENDTSSTIMACRYNSNLHIKAAARYARKAIALAKMRSYEC